MNEFTPIHISRRIVIAAGLYAILAGTISLVGWFADIPRLTDWIGIGIPMFANTSFMVAVTGAGLLVALMPSPVATRIGIIVGLFVGAFGIAMLYQHVTGVNLGIDTLLIARPWGERAITSPGRPGPPAAICFTLLGAALVMRRFPGVRPIVPAIGVLVFSMALVAMMGYLFHADPLFAAARYTGIALPTASIFCALGLGLILTVPEREPTATLFRSSSGGMLVRRALPIIVVLPILLAWLRTMGEQVGYYDEGTGRAVLVLSFVAMSCALLWWCKVIVEKQESELRGSEARLRQLVSTMPAAMYTCDAEGRLTYFNRLAAEIWGCEPNLDDDRFRYCGAHRIWLPDGSEVSHDQTTSAQVLRNGRSIRGAEAVVERPDGSRVVVSANIDPLIDAHGNRVGVINIFEDVTARKEFEKRLEQANDDMQNLTAHLENRVRERTSQLEEQSDQLRRLALQLTEAEEKERKRLAEMLHDHLQQVLIAANMRLRALEVGPPQQARLADAIALIEEANDASRSLTAELRPPVLYEGGLVPALRFLVRKFEDQYRFKARLTVAPDGEPKSASNKIMLYQTARELLLNAVKYSGILQCELILERLPGDDIRLTVRDEGLGFDPKRIGAKDGHGFGLFNISERARALGGSCTTNSAPGRGSEFQITVPDAEVQAERRRTLDGHSKSAAPIMTTHVEKQRGAITVLVADDHRIVRQSIATMLCAQPFVHQVLESANGRDAVELARVSHPDIVLMDLNMPHMNGIEATRALHASNPEIKIIGLSVQTEKETAQAMIDAGAVMYLNKGEDINHLIGAIRGLVGLQPAAN